MVDSYLLGSCWIPGLCVIYSVIQHSGFAMGSGFTKEGDETGAEGRGKEMGVGGGDGHGMGQSRLPRGNSSSVWIMGIRQGLHRPTVAEGLVGRRTSTRKGTGEETSLEKRKDDISPLAGTVVGETGVGSWEAPAPPRPGPRISPSPPQPSP